MCLKKTLQKLRSFQQPLFPLPTPLFISAIAAICIVTTHEAEGPEGAGTGSGVPSSLSALSPPPPRLVTNGSPGLQRKLGSGLPAGCRTASELVGPIPGIRVLAQGKFPCWRSLQQALKRWEDYSAFARSHARSACLNRACTSAFWVSFSRASCELLD